MPETGLDRHLQFGGLPQRRRHRAPSAPGEIELAVTTWRKSDAGQKVPRLAGDGGFALAGAGRSGALAGHRSRVELRGTDRSPALPPGVYKHRSIEDAERLRDQWEEADFKALWERRGVKPEELGKKIL
jgi:hypothetical protein